MLSDARIGHHEVAERVRQFDERVFRIRGRWFGEDVPGDDALGDHGPQPLEVPDDPVDRHLADAEFFRHPSDRQVRKGDAFSRLDDAVGGDQARPSG